MKEKKNYEMKADGFGCVVLYMLDGSNKSASCSYPLYRRVDGKIVKYSRKQTEEFLLESMGYKVS